MSQEQSLCKAGLHLVSDPNEPCPHCARAAQAVPPTEPIPDPEAPLPPNEPPYTEPLDEGDVGGDVTEPFYPGLDFFDPVVGWLVCVGGPHKGKDYRLRAGYNTIGRAIENRVAITGDSKVSRKEHARVGYDPRSRQFELVTGSGSQYVYLNEKAIHVSAELKDGDIIELGKTTLRFVPFCGPDFDWQ